MFTNNAVITRTKMQDFEYSEAELAEILGDDDCFTEIYCFCCTPAHDKMIVCSAKNCEMEWFHVECVGLEYDSVPENWFCDDCKDSTSAGKKKKPRKEMTEHKKGEPSPKVGKQKMSLDSSVKTTKTTTTTHKDSIKRKSIQPVQTKFTKEDAIKEAKSIIKAAIGNALSNPIVLMDKSIQEGLQKLNSVLESNSQDSCINFSQNLVEKFWSVTSGITEKATTDSLDKMCSKFHQISTNTEFITELNNYLNEIEVVLDKSIFLIQCLLEGLTKVFVQRIVQESNLVFEMPTENTSSIKMSEQEEQALRYTAGYISQSMLKVYTKRKESNKVAAAYCTVLSSWNESSSFIQTTNFLSYTRRLVEFANRGGLFCIKDNVFIFFRRMETVIKPVLQSSIGFTNVNLKEKVKCQLNESRLVQLGWESICTLETEMSNLLLSTVIERWIKLRLHAYAQACIFLRKIKNDSVSKKGQKSLRKQLKSN